MAAVGAGQLWPATTLIMRVADDRCMAARRVALPLPIEQVCFHVFSKAIGMLGLYGSSADDND